MRILGLHHELAFSANGWARLKRVLSHGAQMSSSLRPLSLEQLPRGHLKQHN